MVKNIFILKHKDIDVAILQLNDDGEIENDKILRPERVPVFNKDPERGLCEWWRDRSIPEGRDKLELILAQYGCNSPSELLMKNLGLSLTDAYWICPNDYNSKLSWDDVNLYKNGEHEIHFHFGEGRVHYSASPNPTLGGTLEKYAHQYDNDWYLEKKYNTKYADAQQNVNEIFASELHKLQEWNEYTPYTVERDNTGICVLSRCKYFTNEDLELLSAYAVTGGHSSHNYNPQSELDQFLHQCTANGLDEAYVRRFIDYQISTDFIISNTDRHWENFGILRDPVTLQFKSMAPIYDSGNSMFFESPMTLNRMALLKIETNGICKLEAKTLDLINNKYVVNTDLLPSPKDVLYFFEKYGISEQRANMIAQSYSNKLDLFMEYQHGISISFEKEMYEYIDAVPYINQKPNKAYFEKNPKKISDIV